MNFNQLKKLSYKEKKSLVKSIFKEYQKAHEIIGREYNSFPGIAFGVIKESHASYNTTEKGLLGYLSQQENAIKVIEKVGSVFQELSIEQKRIIYTEFISNEKHESYWWEEYYSRSTYYRLKKDACNTILFNLLC